MNPKHKDLDIPNDDTTDPFINCKLDRKKYADVLTGIINSYEDGFVMGLNNKWGYGKTTFVKMWKQQLHKKSFKTLYFNAWENDFEKDVLIALISELKDLKDTVQENTFNTVVEKAAPLAKKLLTSVGKATAKRYLGEGFTAELLEGAFEVGAEEIEKGMEAYAGRKQGILDFKKALEKFAQESSSSKPIVFFVDELDRCRPNYAVEVLEQIKHFFSIKGIVFVLSVDKEQLGHAIRGVYGSDLIDADEYLRRFIDIEYSLPTPNTKVFVEYLFQYYGFSDFFNSSNRKESSDLREEEKSTKASSSLLFDINHLNLRQQERVFAHARITVNSFKEMQYVFPELFIYLIMLRSTNPSFYQNIKRKKLGLQKLLTDFAKPFPDLKSYSYIEQRSVKFLEHLLLLSYAKYLGIDKHDLVHSDQNETKLIVNSDISVSEDNDLLKTWILQPTQKYSRLNISYLLDRIELLVELESK